MVNPNVRVLIDLFKVKLENEKKNEFNVLT